MNIYEGSFNFQRDNNTHELLTKYFNCSNRGLTICGYCLRISQTKDIARHHCKGRLGLTRLGLSKFTNQGLCNLRLSVIYTICILKPILGRDVSVYIAKFVYSFRSDITLYKPQRKFDTMKLAKIINKEHSKKERKGIYKHTKEIVDTYQIYHHRENDVSESESDE